MALLEVVLLAGPAFAVGARRRRRELALVAATGGDRRDVRNIVLASGAVLGLCAAVLGVTAGIGLAAGALPVLEQLSGSVSGHFDVRPLELAGIAAVGLLTGLLAAIMPARAAARQDVVAALAGRRGVVRTRARVPLIGLLLALAGTALAVGGAVLMHSVAAILGGAVIAEIGLIVCTPSLLGLVSRLGRWLPLAPRLALRDSARNRSAATPAVAAVMAAVAGSVGIGIVVASTSGQSRANYQPSLAYGDAIVQLDASSGAMAPRIADVLRRTLPARQVVILHGDPCQFSGRPDCLLIDLEVPAARACPLSTLSTFTAADARRYGKDPRCTHGLQAFSLRSGPLVDDGSAVPAMAGSPAPEAVAALRSGRVLVLDPWLIENGKVTLAFHKMTLDAAGGQSDNTRREQVPAFALSGHAKFAQVILPPEMARRLGVPAEPTGVYADDRTVPTDRQEQAASAGLAQLGTDLGMTVEHGYVDRYSVALLALVIGAGVITLGAAAIATTLSNVDSRQDLTTLAAVGASPRVRRLLSMARSAVIAGLGTALGTIAGFVPAVGVVLAQRALDPFNMGPPLEIPWSSLVFTALVVPAIAVAMAGLFSRSRLPVERRAAT